MKTEYNEEQIVSVGIVSGERINFSLNGLFAVNGEEATGKQCAFLDHGIMHWNGKAYTDLRFIPIDEASSFSLKDVVIGVNFHWERKETQSFLGALHLKPGVDGLQTDGISRIWAINEVPVEKYLESVISSEMSATRPISRCSRRMLSSHARGCFGRCSLQGKPISQRKSLLTTKLRA